MNNIPKLLFIVFVPFVLTACTIEVGGLDRLSRSVETLSEEVSEIGTVPQPILGTLFLCKEIQKQIHFDRGFMEPRVGINWIDTRKTDGNIFVHKDLQAIMDRYADLLSYCETFPKSND